MLLLVIGQYIHTNIYTYTACAMHAMMCVIKIIYTFGLRHNIYAPSDWCSTIPSYDSCILDSNYSSEIAVQVASRKKSESQKKERKREKEEKEKENWTNLNKYALKSEKKPHDYFHKKNT